MGKKKIAKKSENAEREEQKLSSALSAPSRRKEGKSKIQSGKIYVNSSYNNTIITATDNAGGVIAWASAGSLGFSGPKKATPFASSKVVEVIAERLRSTGPTDVEVIVRGVGSGRDSAIRSLVNQGFTITSIRDVTPIPHNGPRPPKPRRV